MISFQAEVSSTESQPLTEASDAADTEATEGGNGSNSSEENQETVVASEETATEAPRGLSSLLAGRRRLTARRPGTIL